MVMLSAALSASGNDRLLIHVTPSVCFAPANLIVRTIIERDPANRAMEVIAESPDFYRSSEVQIDGDKAPRTTTFEFRSLPSGTYQVSARLLDGRGRPLAEVHQQVSVMSAGSDGGQ
jgi:hypothetical protein